MKKIFLIFVLFIFTFWNIFAFDNEKFNFKISENFQKDVIYPYINVSQNLSFFKIDFSWVENKELQNFIEIYKQDENFKKYNSEKFSKLSNWPEIFKKVEKSKILDLVKQNKIQIYSSLCGPYYKYFSEKNLDCIFDENRFTNSKFTSFYRVNSKENKEIEIKIFPNNPDFYNFDSYEISESKEKSPLLTFFDGTEEYYDVKISNLEKMESFNPENHKNFEKKYLLKKFKDGTYVYFPYYVAKIKVKSWENNFEITYKRYLRAFDEKNEIDWNWSKIIIVK